MKKRIMALVSVILIFGIIGCASYTHTQAVRNEIGNVITEVYIRDTGTNDWGSVKNVRARTDSDGYIIRRQDGSVAYWDRVNMNNATQIVFFRHENSSETPNAMKNQDILVIDTNGIRYAKFDVSIAFTTTKSTNILIMDLPNQAITTSDPITFTARDKLPTLTVINQTGYAANVTAPIENSIANQGRLQFQPTENNRSIDVIYRIEQVQVQFTEQVSMSGEDTTVTLTRRPPTLTVVNQTGYTVTLTAPNQSSISNQQRAQFLVAVTNRSVNVTYRIGQAQYTEQVTMGDEDATVTLTRRPPNVTIVNNTGYTINLVQMRVASDASWLDRNILGLTLNDDGTVNESRASTNANERSGSIVNRDSFRFWLGMLSLTPDRYDIRVDDVQGNSYVKGNVQITNDMSLTFTQADRR